VADVFLLLYNIQMTSPDIKPIKVKEFSSKQSKYDIAGKLPMRSAILGPSGSGKTILLQNMVLDIYRDCFERIFIFSPSINVDATWLPVKKYIEKDMKVNTEKEQVYFDEYHSEDLEKIIDMQHKLVDHMKKQDYKKIHQILIILDDVADIPNLTRQSKLLHALYTRGRHTFISTITATQVFNALHPLIRKNITELYVYRLRNYRDLEAVLEELMALTDKKTLLEMYNKATEEPYSFLYINLMSKTLNNMFYIRYDKKILLE
jgi:hypothetical protein